MWRGETARAAHLVLRFSTFALQPVHVPAHARGKRFLKLNQIGCRNASAEFFFELCGPDSSGRCCRASATGRDSLDTKGSDGNSSKIQNSDMNRENETRAKRDMLSARRQTKFGSVWRAGRHTRDYFAPAPFSSDDAAAVGATSLYRRASRGVQSANDTGTLALRAACDLIVMKTEPFWQAPNTLLRSARKASGARTTMDINDGESERWGSYEGFAQGGWAGSFREKLDRNVCTCTRDPCFCEKKEAT